MDKEAKQAGMTTAQFRKTLDFEGVDVIAKNVANYINSMSFIQELRDLYKYVYEITVDEMLKGPTGHQYKVTDLDNFRKIFPNFLQSYEFALLRQSTIRTMRKYPDSELLYHFHDSNVIAVRRDEKIDFLDDLNKEVEKTGFITYKRVITNLIFGFLVLNCYKFVFTSINNGKLKAVMETNKALNLNRVGTIDRPTQNCMDVVMSYFVLPRQACKKRSQMHG